MRTLRRLLPLVLLLILGLAAAQDATKLPECALPPGSVQANPNGSNLTLTAFLPNAPCNIAQITYFWGYWGLWKGMALVGLGLTAALFFWSLFQAVLSKTPEKALTPFVIAVVLSSSVLVPATKDQGVIPIVQRTGIDMFNSLYRVSANVGYTAMSQGENSVQQQTAVLGRNLALLVARAQHASTIRAQMQQIKAGKLTGDLADPNLANTLYAEQVRNEQAGANAIFSNGGWIFDVGYWILYGLFSVFASIIVLVGGGMQLGMLLLPVMLSFLVIRQYQPLKNFGLGYLTSLLVIALLPIVIASMASLAISIPASRMAPIVTQLNGEVAAQLTRYQELLRTGCQWYEVSCNFETQVFNPILSDLSTVKEIFNNLILTLLAGIVGLGIATTFTRRLPATIATFFGASGAGGESSGVETGGLGKILAMSGGMRMLQQLSKAPGGVKPPTPSTGPTTGPQAGGPPALPGNSGGGGGAQYTPPASVTAGSGTGATSTSSNIPPMSVTSGGSSTPRTAVGAGYAAFQGARGAGAPLGQAVQAGAQPMIAGAVAGVKAQGQTIRQDYGEAAQRGRENLTRTAANLAFGSANAERGRAAVGAAVQDFREVNTQVRAQAAADAKPVNPDEFEVNMPRTAAASSGGSGASGSQAGGTGGRPQVARPPQAQGAQGASAPPNRNARAASGAGGQPIPGVMPTTGSTAARPSAPAPANPRPARPVPASPAPSATAPQAAALPTPPGPAAAPTTSPVTPMTPSAPVARPAVARPPKSQNVVPAPPPEDEDEDEHTS